MKKLYALLLALCMLCGAVSVGAEEAMQEVELYGARFKIPAELEITEIVASAQSLNLRARCENYELAMYVTDWADWGYMKLRDDMDDITKQWYSVFQMLWLILGVESKEAIHIANDHLLRNIGMEDGKFVAFDWTDTSATIGHTDGSYAFFIVISSETGKAPGEMVAIGEQIALSFQREGAEESFAEEVKPDEPMTEVPEAEEEQEVELYGARFKIPAELKITEIVASAQSLNLRARCENYELAMYVTDWADWTDMGGFQIRVLNDDDTKESDKQWNSVSWMLWLILGLENEEAADIGFLHHYLRDIGMADGKMVAFGRMETPVSIGHTDGSYAFHILISSDTGKDRDEMEAIGTQIALSFQRDGAE